MQLFDYLHPQHKGSLDLMLLQHNAQLWNELLFISGVKLELPKCFCYMLSFQFKPTAAPLSVLEASPATSLGSSDTRVSIEIRNFSA
jgi:hypothetical protein